MCMCICIFLSISVMYMHTYSIRVDASMYVYIYTHMYVWAYTNTLSCRIPEINFVEISWKLFKHGQGQLAILTVVRRTSLPLCRIRESNDWWFETIILQDGAPKIAKLVYKWLNSMVYGRYNYNGDYFMVYKPTYNWGAPSSYSCYVKPSLTLPIFAKKTLLNTLVIF